MKLKIAAFKWTGFRVALVLVAGLAVQIALILAGDPTVTGAADYWHKLITRGPRVLLGIVVVCVLAMAAMWSYYLAEDWLKTKFRSHPPD